MKLKARLIGLIALLCLAAAAPAHGDPGDVPDAGARPDAVDVPLPPGTTPNNPSNLYPQRPAPPVVGPRAAQIMAENQAVQALSDQVRRADEDLQRARQLNATAQQAWQQATGAVAERQREAESAAAAAYRESARVPDPIEALARDIGALAPGVRSRANEDLNAAAWALRQAQELERTAQSTMDTATVVEQTATSLLATLRAQFDQRKAALDLLIVQNAAELASAEAERNRAEGLNGANLPIGTAVNGMKPHPKALVAVQHAMKQIGKPYVWGAEGPAAYDCSGLVWDSYRVAGRSLPRTARPQYRATANKLVRISNLLAGDLVFFGTNPSDWNTITHVGIYIGNGKMVNAQNRSLPVRVTNVWWSQFFAATRVFDAVPAPPASPPPTTSPKPPPPTWSPSPSPSQPSPTSPPSTAPSTAPSPSTTPSAQPTQPSPPSPTPAAGQSCPTPSGSASPSTCPPP